MKSKLGFDLTPLLAAEKAKLAESLDAESARVLLHHGTEAPFCGQFYDHEVDGAYVCGLCALPLFTSKHKFYSKSGWPSFFDVISDDHMKYVRDTSHGMVRTEILCPRCDGHLGHVFDDGPRPTGLRFCLNSVSLDFVPDTVPLPNKVSRGDPERL